MSFIARLSPLRAIADLRAFLSMRHPHELLFGVLAIVLTGLLILGFVHDSHFERAYKPDIFYVQSWPLSRSDREIIAQQKIDQVKRDKEQAELRARQLKLQSDFKKVDDGLKAYGL